jgi:hypothetical protein
MGTFATQYFTMEERAGEEILPRIMNNCRIRRQFAGVPFDERCVIPSGRGGLVRLPLAESHAVRRFVVQCRKRRRCVLYSRTPETFVNLKSGVPRRLGSIKFLIGLSAATGRLGRKYHLDVRIEAEDPENGK